MAKKIDYAKLFTLRADGRYTAARVINGKKKYFYDRDPEKLWHKINDPAPAPPVVFGAVLNQWLSAHSEQVSYKTAESYTAPCRRIIAQFGDRDLCDVTAGDIDAFLRDLGAKKYSRRSVQLHRDIINMVFNYAVLCGLTSLNPVAAVSMPKNLAVSKRELPSDAALQAVRDNLDAPFGLFAYICLYAGLRRGETLALKYDDIDRSRGVLRVSKAVSYVGNTPVIKAPKTAAGVRECLLPAVLADAIPKKASGYIFTNSVGGLLTKIQFRKRWLKYCEIIGHNITPHQLRHGFATMLYEAGIPDKDAQELLGHSSIAVTRDVYTHIRASRKINTARQLNEYITKQGF